LPPLCDSSCCTGHWTLSSLLQAKAQFVSVGLQCEQRHPLTFKDLQSQNFIFMLIEPNCSVIAACLPCYGPLVRGGRSQLSLIHSVRSLFSLRSRTSQGSTGNRGSEGSRSPNGSQIELKQSEGQSTVVVERYSNFSDSERGGRYANGTSFRSDVQVVRD
jgi:hypothetical protein